MKNRCIFLSLLMFALVLGITGCANSRDDEPVPSQLVDGGVAVYFGKYDLLFLTDESMYFTDGKHTYNAMNTLQGVSKYDEDDIEDYYIIICDAGSTFTFDDVDKAFNEKSFDGSFCVIEAGYFGEYDE